MNEEFFPPKEKFINPFTDEGFKRIFGNEINKDMIIRFLNSLLNETITDITFRNVEALGICRNDRKAVFDIFCETDKHELIIVEMQKSSQKYFSDRVLYYASFAIQQQATYAKEQLEQELKLLKEEQEGNSSKPKRLRWNYAVNRVYVVCFLNYIMDRKHPAKYRWDIIRMDRELKEPFSDTLMEIYLEMPKFNLRLSECDTLYKKFLFVLNNIEIMERLPKELNEQIFQKLKSIVEIERMTPDERLAYELSLSTERDLYACMETKYEEGLEKGIEKGKAEGLAEGIKSVAVRLKRLGMDLPSITHATGLTEAEIQAL
ncbi:MULTISPECIES: Rpn family recombination-promoting nuclease/putative transposase [Parabacteroides]|jgi:hypothetical protein|uniref:Rpn family recombination-promoting nuclease/putative transposase n=1 Tax=Parabacteroides TaxID=375288 RepID=UPI000EFF3846|nr:Rpn family recombination-promoting nuclease/putative transposase [Parabacteroides sp. AF18-52]RHR41957.1 Rpn family recombination-promoting nuclease/putative transposase [Parabacteroides sp. AF18-52]